MKTKFNHLCLHCLFSMIGFWWYVCPTSALSTPHYDFQVDNIFYRITSVQEKTVAVTYNMFVESYSEDYISSGYGGSVTIPATVTWNSTTYKVTAIDRSAFESSSITSISIPNSITSIGYGAFVDCTSLNNVTIPQSVTSIGDYAFQGCI